MTQEQLRHFEFPLGLTQTTIDVADDRGAALSGLKGHTNIAQGLRASTWKTQQLLAKLGIVKK